MQNLEPVMTELLDSEARHSGDTVPIGMRTPVTECGAVISALCDIWDLWSFGEKNEFMDDIFTPLWNEENTSGEFQIDQIEIAENMTEWEGKPLTPGFKEALTQIAVGMTACAFAIQAFKAEKNSLEAWSYTCEAKRWLGVLQGTIAGRSMEQGLELNKFSLAGLDARHSENRKMKADVFSWCDKNMRNYKSMDSAAEAIAGKLVPVTFRTARSWIADWKKKQSTGTP
ncbi:hypothetical protein [Massilia agri]|uniref:Uncharacterized protein n=1 Tax=Massilia agri TaxID=1886785 RepID=A0ABT2ATS2_9BURK|nr:hypothetical protein [Massilia agri]MCS0599340.1 hypothetical protein [Massilia agri]